MTTAATIELLEALNDAKVLVVGDVMLDRFVYGSMSRISPEAPIPILSINRTTDMPGGAANVARNLATLGAQATLVGVVGSDATASELRRELEKLSGVDVRLVVDSTRATTTKIRYVAERQQVLRADIESTAAIPAEVEDAVLREFEAALAGADVVVLSDYNKGVLSESATHKAIAAARAAGKKILVDPKGRSFRKYKGSTIVTPNRVELQVVSDAECSTTDQVVTAAKTFLEQGICEAMIVTRGAEGMTVVDPTESVHLAAVAREVYDVSGAGDTVLATLAGVLAVGGSVAEAARLANVAAGIVVGKSGTATVSAGEIRATLELHDEPVASRKHMLLQHAVQVAADWRQRGLKVAFTNGCFDLLHPGHISLLEQARAAAHRLIVGLNSDVSVKRLKGDQRPIQSEVARATVLASLACVDGVVIFSEDTPIALIEALQPDVLVKGADYKLEDVVGADLVTRRGGRVLLVDLVADQSTTKTLKRASSVLAT